MVSFSRPSQWLYLDGTCADLGHTWHPSCVYSSSEVFLFVVLEAFKIYLPLYLLSNVSRLRDVRWLILNLLPNVLRSCIFLAVNGSGFVGFLCIVRRLVGRFYIYSSAFLPALLASLCAILIERKNRRGLLMGYVSTQAIEVIFSILKSKGIVKALPYGEVALFGFATAVLFHRQRTSDSIPRDAVGTVLGGLLNPPLPNPYNSHPTLRGLADLVMVGVWSFSCGYLVQSLLSLLTNTKKLLKGTWKLKDWLLNKYSLKFGLFLASLTTGFKLSNWALKVLAVPRDIRLLIAGLVAGVSMLFVRSPALSLYATWKALEVLYFKAVDRGYARAWYYGDVLLYAFSTAVIFHGVCFEAHHVTETYFRFLTRVTRGRVLHIGFPAMDYFGTNASLKPMEYRRQYQEQS